MVCNYVSSFTWCHVQNKRSTTTTQNNVYNIYIAVRERKYKSLYFIHVEIENMSRFEYTYVLTNVHVFSRYFIDVITIINTQLKNTSINYLLFDFNTRRIILIIETMRIETFNKMRLLRLQEDILSYFLSH